MRRLRVGPRRGVPKRDGGRVEFVQGIRRGHAVGHGQRPAPDQPRRGRQRAVRTGGVAPCEAEQVVLAERPQSVDGVVAVVEAVAVGETVERHLQPDRLRLALEPGGEGGRPGAAARAGSVAAPSARPRQPRGRGSTPPCKGWCRPTKCTRKSYRRPRRHLPHPVDQRQAKLARDVLGGVQPSATNSGTTTTRSPLTSPGMASISGGSSMNAASTSA